MIGTVANGNIGPMLFVKIDTTVDDRVLQAGAGDKVFGVSQQATRNPPYSSLDDGYAAIAGEPVRVFQADEEECWLIVGGTVTPGDYLKSDASGRGVTSSSDGEYYGAIALQSGTVGQQIRVKIQRGMRGA